MRLLVVYGTTDGHTRKIAGRIVERARALGHVADALDAAALPAADLDPGAFQAVIVAASVHIGHHQAAAGHFVRQHLATLQGRPSAFVSVSLSAAGDAAERQDAQNCADRFLAETGWRPAATHIVAGAFRFTQYDFFRRWIMRRIAREKGVPADRDIEFTDWADLTAFVDRFLAGLGPSPHG